MRSAMARPAASSLAELTRRPDDSRCIEVARAPWDALRFRCAFSEMMLVLIVIGMACSPQESIGLGRRRHRRLSNRVRPVGRAGMDCWHGEQSSISRKDRTNRFSSFVETQTKQGPDRRTGGALKHLATPRERGGRGACIWSDCLITAGAWALAAAGGSLAPTL